VFILLCSLALASGSAGGGCYDGAIPYLCRCVRGPDGCCRPGREVYEPQPGDLYFGWDSNVVFKTGFILTRAGPPSHVGMMVRLPDGALAILEATTNERVYGEGPGVYLRPVLYRLRTYQGKTWVRKLRCPLTPAQSACLTAFALAQAGKPFARWRSILVPVVSLPCRTKLGQRLCGPAPADRDEWFCSQLLVTAATVIGLLDPCKVKPMCTDPQDMFVDRLLDLSPFWEKPLRLHWQSACDGPALGAPPAGLDGRGH
jgi:hypothetical protein